MKKILLFVLITLIPYVSAEVFITQVLYDPETSELDTEFVEIFNNGTTNIDITGWKLNTTTIQATIPAAIIKAEGYFLIADEDDSGAWPNNWPNPDLEDEITLSNTNSGVQLLDANGNKIDIVGWGNPLIFEGTPATAAAEGQAIVRKKVNDSYLDTNNNSNDFTVQQPMPRNSNSTRQNTLEITLEASVSGNPPVITLLNITPDESQTEGIQIFPVPGKNKTITVNAIITDINDDLQTVLAEINSKNYTLELVSQLNTTQAHYQAAIQFPFYQAPMVYVVKVTASDTSGDVTASINFTYESLTAFEADCTDILFTLGSGGYSEVLGDLNMSTISNPTLRNLGNTPLDFMVAGNDLKSTHDSIPVSNIAYTFLDNDYNSSVAGTLHQAPSLVMVNLQPAQLRELTLRLSVPPTASIGNYYGSLSITGIPS
ncbi:MAG: lamin tail domain-containing protein [Candidatus Woesearchaeota archaeon]